MPDSNGGQSTPVFISQKLKQQKQNSSSGQFLKGGTKSSLDSTLANNIKPLLQNVLEHHGEETLNESTLSLPKLETEHERIKNCGNLFDRRATINQELLHEFFRREPCLYDQSTYKNAARIFHCLKANLNENPILKSLKQQTSKENRTETNHADAPVPEVPKIDYADSSQKRHTLELAFATLKFQKVLEDLIEECQLYTNYPNLKDESSLVCTILFDYMRRKFQLRDRLREEPLDNFDQLVTEIEYTIHNEKTDFAAELAKNRIKADALTLDGLLPPELREVDQHKAELPLYCWINPLKIDMQELMRVLIEREDLKMVSYRKSLEKKCFMVDSHCPNVIMFHYSLRERITKHELVRNYKLIIQDKSSCLAPYTALKLLTKKDDVIITNISGGLVAAFIGCMMEEFEGKVYVYGATTEDKYNEISYKLQQIGCSKYVRIMREEFLNVKFDDSRIENVKVILINAPCSKSALMNPMEFLFQEGEDVKFLRDYTLDVNNQSRIKRCIQDETAILKHAFRFPRVRAIIYQTYSKNSSENEQLIAKSLEEFNDTRRINVFPYKISPPVVALTAEDIQNDEVVKDFKYLQFKPSHRMNGCFIGLLSRDRDTKIDKEAKKAEALIEKKVHKLSAPEPATFREKNFLTDDYNSLLKQRKGSMRKHILLSKRKNSFKKAASLSNAFTLEQEIERLQLKTQLESVDAKQPLSSSASSSGKSTNSRSESPHKTNKLSFESKIAQIGKLTHMEPKRASTPDVKAAPPKPVVVTVSEQPVRMKHYYLRLEK